MIPRPNTIPLSELREGLDAIDKEIVELLNKRANIVLEVKKTKKETNKSIYSPSREKEIIERVLQLSGDGSFPKDALEIIFSNIVSATRSLIGELTVGYLGSEFSLAHHASVKKFGESVTYVPFASYSYLVAKLNAGEIDFACSKLFSDNNSIDSSLIQAGMDTDIRIIGEVPVKPNLSIYNCSGSLSLVETVYASTEDFAQCSDWLRENLPSAKKVVCYNIGDVIEGVKNTPSEAILSGDFNADRLGISVLASSLTDASSSEYKYAILGKEIPPISNHNKTSLLVLSSDSVGSLSKIIEVFTKYKISLGLIESGLLPSKVGEKSFYIELKGHLEETKIEKAMLDLEELTLAVRVLGSFPTGVYS